MEGAFGPPIPRREWIEPGAKSRVWISSAEPKRREIVPRWVVKEDPGQHEEVSAPEKDEQSSRAPRLRKGPAAPSRGVVARSSTRGANGANEGDCGRVAEEEQRLELEANARRELGDQTGEAMAPIAWRVNRLERPERERDSGWNQCQEKLMKELRCSEWKTDGDVQLSARLSRVRMRVARAIAAAHI